MAFLQKKKLPKRSPKLSKWLLAYAGGLLIIIGVQPVKAENLIVTAPTDYWFNYDVPTTFTARTYEVPNHPSDPQLWLYNSEGALIGTNDDWYGLQSFLRVQVEPGWYRLRAGVCCGQPDVWGPNSNWNLDYQLEISGFTNSPTTTTSSTVEETTTTRPSNKFNGVNYAALNKENGCRKSFIPRNDIFIEIDISAFHPNLVANLVNYSFPTNEIHEHFAELYKVDYAKAKELTFKQLYGGVFEQYKNLEFFKRVNSLVEKNWKQFNEKGYIEVPISNYRIEKNSVGEMNPQKLFNYLLQGYETAQNILILWEMVRIFTNKNTKLVLYTYDSFLLDVDETETDVLEEVKQIFKKYKLNTKSKTGYDYDFGKNN